MQRIDKAPATARRPVNLSLNLALVARARGLTGNLSATVETLLTDFVEAEEQRVRAADLELGAVIDTLDALHDRTGLLSDEFSQF
jgi:antitoxin CcdA